MLILVAAIRLILSFSSDYLKEYTAMDEILTTQIALLRKQGNLKKIKKTKSKKASRN